VSEKLRREKGGCCLNFHTRKC